MNKALLYGALFVIVILCVRLSDGKKDKDGQLRSSKGKNTKGKNKKGQCVITQDKNANYVVICDPKNPIKPTKRPRIESSSPNDWSQSDQKSKCKCERGRRGPKGNKGPKGSRGRQGKIGLDGAPGKDGRDGRTGIQGLKGPAGPPGLHGPPGLQGPKGVRGFPGIPGINGKRGLPGQEGPPGNCIKKSNVGNVASPQFYCLPGKQGIKGPKGGTGVTGPAGPAGPSGKDGQKGETGVAGPRGRIGRPGPPGDFNNFYCGPRYTGWIDKNKWDSSHPDVFCDTKEFLQGFRIENDKYRKRYRYICCKLTKKG